MQENQDQKNINKNYKIVQDSFNDFIRSILRVVDGILVFFSLRKTEQFWGIVYDAVSKQPLDPVIVKLLYTDGREVETCVTDLGGRYGFLAKPGKFKIYARKTNYNFPSKYASASSDGIFENLYHGEFFLLGKDSEVVGPNIPMDPIKFDWNQQAKLGVINNRPYLKLFIKRIVAVLFWFSFVFFLLIVTQRFPDVPNFYYYVLATYFLMVLLAGILPEPRLWGEVSSLPDSMLPERLRLELHSSLFAGVSFGKANVHENGRFLLRAAKGKYTLSVSVVEDSGAKVFLCSIAVVVGRSGVYSSTIKIVN